MGQVNLPRASQQIRSWGQHITSLDEDESIEVAGQLLNPVKLEPSQRAPRVLCSQLHNHPVLLAVLRYRRVLVERRGVVRIAVHSPLDLVHPQGLLSQPLPDPLRPVDPAVHLNEAGAGRGEHDLGVDRAVVHLQRIQHCQRVGYEHLCCSIGHIQNTHTKIHKCSSIARPLVVAPDSHHLVHPVAIDGVHHVLRADEELLHQAPCVLQPKSVLLPDNSVHPGNGPLDVGAHEHTVRASRIARLHNDTSGGKGAIVFLPDKILHVRSLRAVALSDSPHASPANSLGHGPLVGAGLRQGGVIPAEIEVV
mmetsp:Transcript_45337/g.98360  ORF Transcript_45337/g.98360 Transcript_45337/m.98360 type:complete len:308 (+) Transcript_45337:599-1522(+)